MKSTEEKLRWPKTPDQIETIGNLVTACYISGFLKISWVELSGWNPAAVDVKRTFVIQDV